MSEPPEEGGPSSSSHQTCNNTPPGSSRRSSRGGFYNTFHAGKNTVTPSRPSFLEHSTTKSDTTLQSASKQNDRPTLKSNSKQNDHSFRPMLNSSSSTPVLPMSSFGSSKRKRPADVVEKPSFKVSEFVKEAPRLPSFGTSLTKAKFDFTSSRSMFYSGRTKFGGSSSVREESTKRIKISPVSKNIRTSLTRVSAAKPYTSEHRTLTSKTAENILKTLNKIVLPQQTEKPQRSEYMPSFASLSKRLREKRKGDLSLPRPPIERLNQIKSVQVSHSTFNSFARNNETETEATKASDVPVDENEIEEAQTRPPNEFENVQKSDAVPSGVSKNGLKMKRQRASMHYSASDKAEEPVNTMPEVTAVQPMVIAALPKFDMNVKPAPAQMFTPIMKPATKTIKHVKNTNSGDSNEFLFSSPKTVSNKNMECQSMDVSFSFISPVAVKNPDLSFVVSKKVDVTFNQPSTKQSCALTPVKEAEYIDEPKMKSEEDKPRTVKPKEDSWKPKGAPAPFSRGFKFAKPEEGSWECPSCMITNKPDSLKCVACTEAKPGCKNNVDNAKPLFSFGLKTVTTTTASTEPSFGKTSLASTTFSVASTNVSASTGFTFSKPFSTTASAGFTFGSDALSTSSKKTESVAPTFPFVSPTDTAKSQVNAGTLPDIVSSVDDKFSVPTGSIFGKPALDILGSGSKPNPFATLSKAVKDGSWECPTCMISNAADCQKCLACTEPKPGGGGTAPDVTEPAVIKPAFKFGATDTSTGGMFSFGTSTSNNTESGGFTFGKASNDTDPSSFSFGKNSPMKSNSVFDKLKPPAGSWSCPACMVDNAEASLKCAACTAPKPGIAPDSKPVEEPATKSDFKFGTPISTFGSGLKASEEFSFKAAAASSNMFLKVKQPDAGDWECPTCMISNKADCLKCAACSEQKPGSQETVMSSTSEKTNSGFSFGTREGTQSGFSFGTKDETKSGFSFGAKDETKTGFAFGTNDEAKSEFSFGTKPISNGSSSFSLISQPDSNSVSSNGPSAFSFVPSIPSIPSLPSITSTGATASSEFSFGKSASNNSGFSFANPSTTSANSNSAFTFGVSSSTNEIKETGWKSTPSVFGNQNPGGGQTVSNGPTVEAKETPAGFNFGSATSFGALNNNAPANMIEVASSTSTNIFGASVPSFDTSKFNGAVAAPVPAAPQFNFGSSSANAPSFMLNSNDTKPPEPAKFNFNPGSIPAPNFTFGAPTNAAAVFGNPTPGGQFNFANNNNNNVNDSSKNDASKVNIFAPPPAGTNLFTIGGGGSTNQSQNNHSPAVRRVKRAHRKLPSRK